MPIPHTIMNDDTIMNDTTLTAAPVGDGLPRSLTPEELAPPIDVSGFGFRTTDELEPLTQVIGQPRALRALQVGTGIRQPNYHIYASGISGTGRMSTILRTLEEHARNEPVPDDWIYVNNFDSSDQPVAISLKAGEGRRLRQEMASLIARLLDELPKAFQREDFSREKDRLLRHYHQEGQAIFDELNRLAKERGLIVQKLEDGRLLFVPLRDGHPITPEEGAKLTPEELEKIEQAQEGLLETANNVFQRQQELERRLGVEVRQVEHAFADRLVAPLLAEVDKRFANPRLSGWLERLRVHFSANLDRFRRRAERMFPQFEAPPGEGGLSDVQERFFEYQVNVVVDNGDLKQAPVIVEAAPNHRNLFGMVERVVDRYGRVATNFTRIKGGSLLRANGGYLVFDLLDALAEPHVWTSLKRTLKRGSAEIDIHDPFGLFTVSGLKPEAIPLGIKLVVIGTPLLYHLLYRHDEDFRDLFKFKADFDNEIASSDESLTGGAALVYGQLVRKLTLEERVPPFNAAAVGVLAVASARLAAHQQKLTAQFSRLCDLIREAAFWAGHDGAAAVEAKHVRRAIDEQLHRSDLIAQKVRELIAEGTLLIEVTGSRIGQVNGLAVAEMGEFAFGWPSRITATVGVGGDGVVNIERESRLSGRTYDKGLLILEGYLRGMYSGELPLALSASLAMEQSYGGVDGDSASAAELIALLSAIARLPLRQDVAITGSIDQLGNIQPIGGVNEKVEGFFEVCSRLGLTGNQGVCIPAANVRNLVLRGEVIDAVREGKFHLWPLRSIDEGIALLTGVAAGRIDQPLTVHGRVLARLREMERQMRPHTSPGRDRVAVASETPPAPPDPKPSLPG